MKCKLFTLATTALAVLALSACSSSKSEGSEPEGYESKNHENGTTSFPSFEIKEVQAQANASDNGYCPLLPYPYDPRLPRDGEVCVTNSDGYKECQNGPFVISEVSDLPLPMSVPDSIMHAAMYCQNREEIEALEKQDIERGKLTAADLTDFSYCDNIDEAEMDSILKAADALGYWIPSDWEREVWRLRYISTKTASLAVSNNRTIINLSPVFTEKLLQIMRLESSKKNDTLHINVVPGEDGSNGMMVTGSGNRCPIFLEIALNYIDEDIAVVVFENEQFFQAKYE